MHHSTTHDIKL